MLDGVVAAGLVLGRRIGVACFFLAALSQIALYTVLRDWILDVPPAFARSPDDLRYLDGLVIFHVVSMILISLALRVLCRR